MKWEKRGNNANVKEMFLNNMGVSSLDDINNWFKKSYANDYNINDLKESVQFSKRFLQKKVRIIGDYDVDGVTATTILYEGLKEFGFTDVSYRIPYRFSEGFGISTTIIDEIDEGLIITCDNGIAGIEAIKKAKEKGLSVIVIDHHEPVVIDKNIVLPDADYIIDPNAIKNSADFNGYCGAGLAYKFICELLGHDKKKTQKYLGLAAIGTVADVMNLHEENYVIVRNGLKALAVPALCSKGLNALLSVFDLLKDIKASDIAFRIGPAINSASRMEDKGATKAVELLTFNGSLQDALSMATELKKTNDRRKEVEKEAYEKAISIIEERGLSNLCPLVIHIPDAHEGVIGIVAGSLCEKYKVPTLAFTDVIDKNGVHLYKGSARTCGTYHIKNAFDRNAELFLKYGGHAEAGGMTILPSNFDKLTNALNKENHDFCLDDKDVIYYDIEVEPEQVQETIKQIKSFEPFGKGNPEPVVRINNFRPCLKYGNYRRILGEKQTTIKINSNHLDALGFGMASQFATVNEKSPLSIIGRLSENIYKGTVTPQIQIQDFMVS